MDIATQGEDPLIVLAHGWPELWYRRLHALPALAADRYHAAAREMRGQGQSDALPHIQNHPQFQLVGDVVGLIRALGRRHASAQHIRVNMESIPQ
jgi:pimeloyl-ACP methyl ester carboxylesterase